MCNVTGCNVMICNVMICNVICNIYARKMRGQNLFKAGHDEKMT